MFRKPVVWGKLSPNFQDNCARFSSIEPSLKTMEDQQQFVPVVDTDARGFPILDDQSMNGSNGSALVIEYPKDRLGPIEDAPTCTFYIYAPLLHWHQSPTTHEPAQRAIEQLADEAFRFGQHTEHHEQMPLDGQQVVEAYVKEFRTVQDQENNQLRDQVKQRIRGNWSLKES